jgi:hypothetical protein
MAGILSVLASQGTVRKAASPWPTMAWRRFERIGAWDMTRLKPLVRTCYAQEFKIRPYFGHSDSGDS